MAQEYITPDFLKDSDEDVIHNRMLSVIPDTIDKSEGGFVWDFTRPTAIEHARLKGFDMNECVKLIWPQFASGIYLDYHGENRGLERKEGTKATGILEIVVKSGSIVKKGDLFTTEAINRNTNIIFSAVQDYSFSIAGTYEIEVECTDIGTIGNVAKNTIVMKGTQNDGITSVTNPNQLSGGIDPESDDDYRIRLVEYDRNIASSYIGNVGDYTRWANEVNGVGSAKVIPAQDDTGLVTIVVTDGNGDPATTEICQAVYNHIMRPDSPIERKAPINALLNVIPPETLNVTITATVEIKGSSIDKVKQEFLQSLKSYFYTAMDDNEIRYTYIGNLLGDTKGVYDYKNLTINGTSANIALESDVMPVISLDEITLTEGSV